MNDKQTILSVNDLQVYYDTPEGKVEAVDHVSFSLREGERLGLVGESGSGKTTLAMALMRLHKPPAIIAGGEIQLGGHQILKLSEEQMRRVRLSVLALVPQGAMNSLNPVLRVREQIMDGILDHETGRESRKRKKEELTPKVDELLRRVGLQKSVGTMYPHELSGGMKQRVAMAIATSMNPRLILADEPTSALDVVVQRQIMDTLGRLQEGLEAAVILIGHDMGLMAQFADRIGVMYAGELAELSPVRDIFEEPLHPYAQALISSLPTLEDKRKFIGIPGLPPRLLDLPSGCVFHPRCPKVMDRCRTEVPSYHEVKPNRWARCHLYPEKTGR
jgi:peptide/nickel transport system ATP-binding protein